MAQDVRTVPSAVASWSGAAVFVLFVAANFVRVPWLPWLGCGLLAVYAAIEFPRTPRLNQAIIGVLAGVGCALALVGGHPFAALVEGFQRAGLFFVLFVSVLWLRSAAERSPALHAAQDFALGQPPARRDLMVAAISHVIGAVLNLAGLSLVSSLISSQPDERLRRQMAQTISRVFLAAICWTPFYTAMTMVLTVVPGLTWSDVAPVGFTVAGALIALTLALGRLERETAAAGPRGGKADTGPICRALAILALMFVLVIGMAEGVLMPLPIALGVVAPFFGMAWAALQLRGAVTAARAGAEVIRRVFADIPGIRGEALLFLGANVLGSGISAAVPTETVRALLAAIAPSPDGAIAIVLAAMLALEMVGVHGVIMVVLVGQVLPPETLQIPPAVYAVMLLAMWGIGSAASPASPTVLYVARPAQADPWVVAWRWNGPYALLAATLIAGLAIAARHLAL